MYTEIWQAMISRVITLPVLIIFLPSLPCSGGLHAELLPL